MTLNPATRLLSPEEIAVQAGQQVPFLRLPERSTVFAEREMRLRQHAVSPHPMRDFLLFMAELAQVQQQALADPAVLPLPTADDIDAAVRTGQPLLDATRWPRDPAWREALRHMLDGLAPRIAGSPAQATVQRVREADNAWLDQQADRLLQGVMLGLDLAAAPLIAAALQVHWTRLVLDTEAARGHDRLPPFGRTDDATRCPCCGSLPVASVSRIGADASGYRYLHCSLCSAQWHMVRIKCTHCEQTRGIHYQSLQAAQAEGAAAGQAAVEAEACDSCGHYLKIVHMERDPHVEPVADDLVSLTLDLLVAEAGFQRHGVNLMLLFGEGDDAAAAPTPPPDDGGGGR